MSKVKAPLFSLEARGSIGNALTYFPWKGLDAVRTHVVPANPKSADQVTQRGHMTDAVALLRLCQAPGAGWTSLDVAAYEALGSIEATPRTWFNTFCKQFIDQKVAAKYGAGFRAGATTEGDAQLAVEVTRSKDPDSANDITAGTFFYGTSRTALNSQQAAAVAAGVATATLAGLTNGVKYYWQFRPTAHADFVGTRSGIYSGTPHA